jgi:hypothetical protein
MALRSLKDLDLPQDRFPFVSSLSLPSPLSKIFLHVIKPSHFGPANTPSSFRFAQIQFLDDPVLILSSSLSFLKLPALLRLRTFQVAKWKFLWLFRSSRSVRLIFLLGFVTIAFLRGGIVNPTPNPPTWRTRVSLFVWNHTIDLSGLGDPDSSYATAGLAVGFIGTHKAHHHDKVETPLVGLFTTMYVCK